MVQVREDAWKEKAAIIEEKDRQDGKLKEMEQRLEQVCKVLCFVKNHAELGLNNLHLQEFIISLSYFSDLIFDSIRISNKMLLHWGANRVACVCLLYKHVLPSVSLNKLRFQILYQQSQYHNDPVPRSKHLGMSRR